MDRYLLEKSVINGRGCLSYEQANNYIIKVITTLDNRCTNAIKTPLRLADNIKEWPWNTSPQDLA